MLKRGAASEAMGADDGPANSGCAMMMHPSFKYQNRHQLGPSVLPWTLHTAATDAGDPLQRQLPDSCRSDEAMQVLSSPRYRTVIQPLRVGPISSCAMALWSSAYITIFIALTTIPCWYSHYELYRVLNPAQLVLALFCSINILICFWELSLFYNRVLVRAEYHAFQKKVPKGTLPPMFLFQDVKLRQALTLQHWTKVWSTYSLMDPSYTESNSCGFWIDTGNGHVTLIPSVLFLLGMTWDILPARVLGSISLVYFWQMMYGTVLYLAAYFHNEQWRGRPGFGIVMGSNMIWIINPLWGMYVSYQMIQQGNYSMLRT